MEIIISILSVAVGISIGYYLGKLSRSSSKDMESLKIRLDAQIKTHQLAITEKENLYKQLLKEKEISFQEILKRQDLSYQENLNLLQKHFDETVSNMQAQIQVTTNKILRERQAEFEKSSITSMSSILSPLNDTIAEMKKTMAANTQQQTEFSGIFSANIENLLKQSEAARSSADRLTNVLAGNTKIQGEWGETILIELLEKHGLKEGIHFDTQATLSVDRPLRPDIILHLDQQRDVIIDSKVSLSAYISYVNAETQEEKNIALKNHINSIENHVKELVKKDYPSHLKNTNVGYVIMFVPNTSALLLATAHKPNLWRKAMEQNVYIADEQTLYAALKIFHLTWTQITQNENHLQVYALANEMLDRVGKFMEKYVSIGKSIETLTKNYEDGYKKIQEDGHSIPQTCRKLIKMGAKMPRYKSVPSSLLGTAPESDTTI